MAGRQGERKEQILQALAEMLESPEGEKITTASLAGKLAVSEAALYRHFASKAQMFEGLLAFIEETIFSRINLIVQQEPSGLVQMKEIAELLLGFSQRNRGMTRVLTGDALVHEHERLRARVNQIHERIEATLRQSIRNAITSRELAIGIDQAMVASLILAWIEGRWRQYVRSGFKRDPSQYALAQWAAIETGITLTPH